MNTSTFFRLRQTAIMGIEEIRLARFTPRQGGEGAISGVLPYGDCDLGGAASCLLGVIGASSRCPCISCGGIAGRGVFSRIGNS